MSDIMRQVETLSKASAPAADDLVRLLLRSGLPEAQAVYDHADAVRRKRMGDGILLRGLVEFSNYCRNTCHYCGLAKGAGRIERYRLTRTEILDAVAEMASAGIRTVVLQSGEDEGCEPAWLAGVITAIKRRFDMAVTLSVGERDAADYRLWREAGADRYLLRIETTDPVLYASMHTGRVLATRLRCLEALRSLGYQVGSGIMVGLPGQTLETIARDILFFHEKSFDMVGIGPFIPHADTVFAHEPAGSVDLTLMVIALTRIVTKYAHMPATTALGSLGGDHRLEGLKAGANVLMPNFTPQPYRQLYEIYPGKRCVNEPSGACPECMERMAGSIGRTIDQSRGDSVKAKEVSDV